MKLEFLGTGAADYRLERDEHMEGFRRYSSALLDDTVLFDPGPHIFHYADTFQKTNLFDKVEHVLVTHSHGDHLNMDSVKRLHELRPNCRFYGSEGTSRHFAREQIPFTVLNIHSEYQIGNYLVTPLRSSHTGDFIDEITMVYSIVDKEGKKFFYGTDTGLFPEHTWKYICNREYDLFVMELTIGDYPDAPHLFSHMTLPSFTLMINTMRRRYHPVKEGGTFLVTHLAKNWHKPHAELAEQLAPLGVAPAYDGYVVEI
jgi:phosphoribosyl 1,2-cyclic phosphate phosphodiesterase